MSDHALSVGYSSVLITVSFTPRDRLKKGPGTSYEDTILIDYVKKHGEGRWNTVQKNSGIMRCAKSCRLRWRNHLRPNLKKGNISPEEDAIIVTLHAKLGNKWSTIVAELPGRSDNEIKNYWNTRFKKLKRLGLSIYPPEVEEHFDPFHHRHNHHLNQYRSQLQNKNIMNQDNPQPIEQTLVEPSPPPFESLRSPRPLPLPQQPFHLAQNSSYIDNTDTLFDSISFPQPTQNLNPSYITNSKISQYFRVIENYHGGAGLNPCTKQPTLDHQDLVTPNFPSNKFGSFNLTYNPNLFDFRRFQNSTMGAGVQSELCLNQSVHLLNNNARVEFMEDPSGVSNNTNEMAPELVFEDNNMWSDFLVDGVNRTGDVLVDGMIGTRDFLVDVVTRTRVN